MRNNVTAIAALYIKHLHSIENKMEDKKVYLFGHISERARLIFIHACHHVNNKLCRATVPPEEKEHIHIIHR